MFLAVRFSTFRGLYEFDGTKTGTAGFPIRKFGAHSKKLNIFVMLTQILASIDLHQ
jgi:hypothetical protein